MQRNKCILSTAYLPPVEYFAILRNYDTIELEKYENYPKQSYRNRCHILSPNGMQALSIPVTKNGAVKTYTSNVDIVYNENWNLKNWRAIETAYNNSPYFLYYKDDLESIHNNKETNLFVFNHKLIELLCSFLNIDFSKISFTSSFNKEYSADIDDYRESIHPKKKQYI